MVALEREWDMSFNIRPVYPIAIRLDGWFKNANPMWLPYLRLDVVREAGRLGIPYSWPKPDPVQMNVKTGDVPKEQPYIHRLTRLGVAASQEGKGLPFITQVSAALYDGCVQNWHEGHHLADAAARAGVNLAALDAKITADPMHYESVIEENQLAHHKSGHWGVPTFAYNGEPFFGQDRLDALLWRLQKSGLRKR
jgi:2-hydroxychromene-2-carboxylate isomerase